MSKQVTSAPLRRVGALWKPKPGAKSLGSGELTVNGYRQRFVVLRNERKTDGSRQPDYVLMSSEEPEPDQYTARRDQTDDRREPIDDDVPF